MSELRGQLSDQKFAKWMMMWGEMLLDERKQFQTKKELEMDKQDDEEEEKQLPRSNVSGSLIECA